MRELTLGGIHDNSEYLVLLDSDGERYTVRIDEALRSAVRRDSPALGLLGSNTDRSLSPKEIQSLLRSGASAESIAEHSNMSIEHVRRYESPVRAERAHVARQALTFRTGRGSEDTLADLVTARLSARGVDAEPRWDAWRRADGTWTLQVEFSAGSRARTATWHLDVPSRVARAEDDEARWLSDADEPSTTTPGRPRLTSVRSHVFDVEAAAQRPLAPRAERGAVHDLPGAAPAASAGALSEAQIDELNARRGIPASPEQSPWRSLSQAAQEAQPQHHVGHGGAAGNDVLPTEEVEYVEGPDDLAHDPAAGVDDEDREAHEQLDPTRDPHASAPETDRDEEDEREEQAPESAPAPGGPEDQGEPELTPLPGFQAEVAQPKKPKKGRSSIPSWDDIVFGSKSS